MVTLKDIALEAGVSVDTVSRVLNGKPGERWASSLKRAERIRKIAAQLNYTPNKAARIMRTKKTHQIGVLVSELYNPFTGYKVEAIADELSGRGYEMLLGLTRFRATSPEKFYEKFSENLLDGTINLDPLLETSTLRKIAPQIPCVTFNRSETESPAVFDFRAAVRLIMEHLWELGHRRIALITGLDNGDVDRLRPAAYESFYAERPQAAKREWIIEANWSAEEGQRAAKALITTDCTACVTGNDLLAVGLIAGLRELGRDVPNDYSVASIEDSLFTEISYPTLTSARQPMPQLVELTVQALIEMIEGKTPAPTQVLLPQIVVRNSCTKAR